MITEKRKKILIARCKSAWKSNEISEDDFRVGLSDEENEFLDEWIAEDKLAAIQKESSRSIAKYRLSERGRDLWETIAIIAFMFIAIPAIGGLIALIVYLYLNMVYLNI